MTSVSSINNISATDGSGKRPLWAVFIGINEYMEKSLTPLAGAVADATAWKEYFQRQLNVPSDHISLLTNENATRSAIIAALWKLARDPRIAKEDTIIIFYAGHGTLIDAPASWECDSPARKIQAIVPYDWNDGANPGIPKVDPIPDRTINALLYAISEEKGNHITVILDCCHSASGTRNYMGNADDENALTPRVALLPHCVYSEDLDKEIWDTGSVRGAYKAAKFINHGSGSHMLLAASLPAEEACEGHFGKTPEGGVNTRGRFSFALLALLAKESPDNLQYGDILPLLKPLFSTHGQIRHRPQNPQCEGPHKDKTLFNFNRVARVTPTKSFPVNYKSSQHIVEAGIIQGITPRSKFTVYQDTNTGRPNPIGVLGVKTLKDFSTVATVPYGQSCPYDRSLPTKPYAIQTSSEQQDNLRVWIDPSNGFCSIYEDLELRYSEKLQNVSLASLQRQSDIEIKLTENNDVSMKLHTPPQLMPAHTIFDWTKEQISLDRDHLAEILEKAAKFYGELRRPQNSQKLSDNIELEFFKLDVDLTSVVPEEHNHYVGKPLEPATGEHLIKAGAVTINIPASGPEPYGLKLTNRSNVDLFVTIFSFMNKDLSIASIIETHAKSPFKSDYTLKRAQKVATQRIATGLDRNLMVVQDSVDVPGTLAIGYGAAGHPPFSFELHEGSRKTEVDFIKIYITTEPVNLSNLEQSSPFDSGPTNSRAWKPWAPSAHVLWCHLIFPVVQHPSS